MLLLGNAVPFHMDLPVISSLPKFSSLTNIQRMYIVGFLSTLFFFGGIAVPFYTEYGKLTYAQFFMIEAWYIFWGIALEVPTGVVADRISRKVSIALSGICIGVAAILYSITPNFYLFLLAEFIWAAGNTFISGADDALIYDTLKEEKRSKESKKIMSNYYAASMVGMIFALPIGSLIAAANLYPYPRNLVLPMLATGIPLALASLVALTLHEPKIPGKKIKTTYFKHVTDSVNFLLKHRQLRALAIDFSLVMSLTFFNFWFYQSVLKQVGVDIVYYGFVGAGINVFGFALLYKADAIEKIVGKRHLLTITALVPALAYILMGAWMVLPVALLCIFLVSGSELLREPIIKNYMHKYIPSNKRATVMSSVSMMQKVVMAVAYPIVGYLADWSLSGTLLILGGATLIVSLISKVDEGMLKD